MVIIGNFVFDEILEIEQIVCLVTLPFATLIYSKLRSQEETIDKNIQC